MLGVGQSTLGTWAHVDMAVLSNFRKQLYLHIKKIVVVNGNDRYLLLLISNTGLIVSRP